MAKIGRNDPCRCGSGKKHKRCCGAPSAAAADPATSASERPPFDGTYFRLRISLLVDGPPIWRTILMPANASFADLHDAIQACGWEDAHLWEFYDAKGKSLAKAPGDTIQNQARNATEFPLCEHFAARGDRCRYTYDFGDSWEHRIVLEAIEHHEREFTRALLDGEGRFPPEDCGGVPGWSRLLEFHRTGVDPHGEGDSLADWMADQVPSDQFEPLDLDAERRAFGEVLVTANTTDRAGRPERTGPPTQAVTVDRAMVDRWLRDAHAHLAKNHAGAELHVSTGKATFNEMHAKIELEISAVRSDGVVLNQRAQDFLARAHEFGLCPSHLGRTFTASGRLYRIAGLRPRARASVVCESANDPGGQLTAFQPELVRALLGPAKGGAAFGGEREGGAGA